MQIVNFTATQTNWTWTGVNTRNQMWSLVRITEPIIVDSIDVHWGGYDKGTQGRHFIAEVNNNQLGRVLVQSRVINVPQNRGWRSADVPKTLIEPGTYAVGIWGDHLGRRIVSTWRGTIGSVTYTHTNKSISENVSGDAWRSNGVIPCRINGENASQMSVRVGTIYRKGQVHIRIGTVWRKSKAVFVRIGGAWRRGK